MLIHSRTQQGIDSFLESPSSGLAIIGQRGAGKNYIARHIASQLLAVDSVHSHPHVHHMDARGENGSIESVRELRKKLNLRVPSTRLIRRVVIISHFDALGHEAQNAMLKTLEEPPNGTVFLLTVDNEEKVLPTIYSRLHRLDVLPMTIESLQKIYSNQDSKIVTQSFQISDGAAGLFVSLLEGDDKHPTIVAINEAKRILRQPKHIQIASVDNIIKNKSISSLDILDGMLRILVASNKLQLALGDTNKKRQSHRRVQLVLRTVKDIQNGVGQKLALTQMFLEL